MKHEHTADMLHAYSIHEHVIQLYKTRIVYMHIRCCEFRSIYVRKCRTVQVHRCTHAQAYKCTSIQVYTCRLLHFTGVQGSNCTVAHVRVHARVFCACWCMWCSARTVCSNAYGVALSSGSVNLSFWCWYVLTHIVGIAEVVRHRWLPKCRLLRLLLETTLKK